MSAQPVEHGSWPQTPDEIRRALPLEVRPEFDQALAAASPFERAHVLLLWRGVALDLADPRGDAEVRAVATGSSQAKTAEEWRARGAL